MRDLSVLREDGDSYQWEEIRVLRATTINHTGEFAPVAVVATVFRMAIAENR